jgi:hypothetical protein
MDDEKYFTFSQSILTGLNGVVVSNADCQSKGPGFESRVSHGPFQKVKHVIDNPSCKK